MSVLDTLGMLMEASNSYKSDIARLAAIKKMLNIKESESITTVSEEKIVKCLQTYGKVAAEGFHRYAAITEDKKEQDRIKKVLAMLGL